MGGVRAWIVVIAVVVLVILLIRYARGPDHQRGDDVGAWSSPVSSVTAS
jgi:hypothetical protein